jgi:hypothetical protein
VLQHNGFVSSKSPQKELDSARSTAGFFLSIFALPVRRTVGLQWCRPHLRRIDMQYMFLIYGEEQAYASLSTEQMGQVMAAFGTYTEDLVQAGILRGGSELAPVRAATTVRVRGKRPAITDGPFAETKEQLGGYYLVDCANLDEAIAWAGRCPGAEFGSVEIRPLVPDAAAGD